MGRRKADTTAALSDRPAQDAGEEALVVALCVPRNVGALIPGSPVAGEAFPGRCLLGLGGHRVDDRLRQIDGYTAAGDS